MYFKTFCIICSKYINMFVMLISYRPVSTLSKYRLHVLSPRLLNAFILNFILDVCRANIISGPSGEILLNPQFSPKVYGTKLEIM